MKAKVLSVIIGLVTVITSICATGTEKSSLENASIETSVTSITGRVVDKLTGEALIGAEVEIMGTNKRAYTDFDGNFEIKNIESGAHAVMVSYISYKNAIENIHTNDTQLGNLTIKLKSVDK